jgi:hypothetical protein
MDTPTGKVAPFHHGRKIHQAICGENVTPCPASYGLTTGRSLMALFWLNTKGHQLPVAILRDHMAG